MIDLVSSLWKMDLSELLEMAEHYRSEVTAAMEGAAWSDAQLWCDQLAIALQIIDERERR